MLIFKMNNEYEWIESHILLALSGNKLDEPWLYIRGIYRAIKAETYQWNGLMAWMWYFEVIIG